MYPNIKRFLKEYLPGTGCLYTIGIVSLLVTVLFQALIPEHLREAINTLSSSKEWWSEDMKATLFGKAWIIIGYSILFLIARILSRVYIFLPGRQMESKIRQDFFSAAVSLPSDRSSEYSSGDLISRGTNDVSSVRVMISMGVLHTINSAVMIPLCIYFMFSISAKMTLLLLVPIPIVILTTRYLAKKMMMAAKKSQQELGVLSENTREQFKAHSLLSVFPVFKTIFKRVTVSNDRYTAKAEDLMKSRVYMFAVFSTLTSLGLFILLYFGGQESINSSDFGIGDFIAFSLYLGMIQAPLRALGWLLSIAQRGEVCLQRIYELRDVADQSRLIELERKIQSEEELERVLNVNAPMIEIKDLRFSYPKAKEEGSFELVIDSLKIEKNQTYGIFGQTGSGKTSLLKLLSANLRPSHGDIRFQSVAYKDIHVDSLSRQFSMLPQENSHFSGTIRHNVDLVHQHDSSHVHNKKSCNFEKAFEISQLTHDIAQFKDGLDTVLGEHGINLSGGQKQRLSLLRSLLRPRKVLMLDDFVSAVDHKTEEAIISSLFEELKDETAVLISHRISALKFCDQIIVMEDGRIVNQGSHEELMESNKSYAETYRYQQVESTLEEEAGR